jgi:hypothetical protein
MKKWLTAADIRQEITEGLKEWFEQADNVMETAPTEDTDEDDTDDEDSDTDSDYNSVEAEQDAQEEEEEDPSYKWSHFFRGYIDTTWVDSQEEYHRRLGHDPQKFTGKQWASKLIKLQWQAAHEVWIQRCKELHDKEDGILTAREMQELQAKTRAMYSSAHLLNIHDRKIFEKPIEERLESRLSDLKAWVQQLYPAVQKGIQDANTQLREGVQDIRNFFFRNAP